MFRSRDCEAVRRAERNVRKAQKGFERSCRYYTPVRDFAICAGASVATGAFLIGSSYLANLIYEVLSN